MGSVFDDWPEEKFQRYFPNSRRARMVQKGKKFVQLEGVEQNRFQDWLRKNHKDVRFTADLAGHAESLSKIVHIHRATGFTVPDLMIFEPSQTGYHGIFMEFKKTDFKLHTKAGNLVKDQHIRDQYNTIIDLRSKGYYADFIPGCSRAIDVFTQYMTYGYVDSKFQVVK